MKNKNEFSTHSLDVLLELTEKSLKKSNDMPKQKFIKVTENKINFFHQDQATAAKQVSSILSGLYRQRTGNEWEWLRINRPEWWEKRIALENELDGHFLNNDPAAGKESFYRLVEHLETAPIDNLSSRIARQIDNLPASRPKQKPARLKPPFKKFPGHPEPWQGGRISGREYFGIPPMKKVRP